MWDNDSRDALKAFQKDAGLPPTGLFTRETVAALNATGWWPSERYDVMVQEQATTPDVVERRTVIER